MARAGKWRVSSSYANRAVYKCYHQGLDDIPGFKLQEKPKTRTIQPNPMLQSLVESHHGPFALVDKEFVIVAANRKYAETYAGATPESILGMKCHQVSHKTDTSCELNGEECPLTHVFDNNQPYQVIHRHFDHHHDPDYVAIHASPITGENGDVVYMGEGITSVSHDQDLHIDEQKMVAGCCPSFMGVLENLVAVADTDAPVLILGETGTGKELAARLIHKKSKRALKEFVPVDCTVFTDDMFASELFGHAKGAFTSAVANKRGLYELADLGTLFFDEIGEMPLSMQSKLLRAIESGSFRRVGETSMRHADVRLICATNRDLKSMVDAGMFRADLYYRINCMQVELPPLRHRRNDIPELANYFLASGCLKKIQITEAALNQLRDYPFPGNVRELRNILERAVILAKGDTIDVRHLPRDVVEPELAPALHALHDEREFFTVPARKPRLDSESIRHALSQAHGNRRVAALTLGISERTLYRKLKDHPELS